MKTLITPKAAAAKAQTAAAQKRPVVIVEATAYYDDTFVHQNNSRPKDPYIKASEKAPEPDPWAVQGALAALFGIEPEKDDSMVLTPAEQSFNTKTGKLHEWLKRSGLSFEFDHDYRCFWLSEYRQHHAKKSAKKATKRMRTMNEARLDATVKVIEVRVCLFVSEGTYMFTDESGEWGFAQDKNFNLFIKKVRDLSADLKRRDSL